MHILQVENLVVVPNLNFKPTIITKPNGNFSKLTALKLNIKIRFGLNHDDDSINFIVDRVSLTVTSSPSSSSKT